MSLVCRVLHVATLSTLLLLLLAPVDGFRPASVWGRGAVPHGPGRSEAAAATGIPDSSSSSASVEQVKRQILQLAALTDRGKLQDPLVSEEGLYRAERVRMLELIEQLEASAPAPTLASFDSSLLDGDWDLVYSTAQLFRSSPFFLAIAAAYNDVAKSELFFKLHELQTCSWGVSQIGRVAQHISLGSGTLSSEFDTVLLPLTTIPLIGWFKLLPTFGGRIISIAADVSLRERAGEGLWLHMTLEKTRFQRVRGLGVLPGVGALLEGRDFPTRSAWQLLPWNQGRPPACSVQLLFCDGDMRVMREEGGAMLVYARPVLPPALDRQEASSSS